MFCDEKRWLYCDVLRARPGCVWSGAACFRDDSPAAAVASPVRRCAPFASCFIDRPRSGPAARRACGRAFSAGFYVMWLLPRDFFGAAMATLLVYSAVAVAGQVADGPRMVRLAAPPIDQAAVDLQVQRNTLPARASFINQTELEADDTPGTLLGRVAVADPAAVRFLRENAVARALFTARSGTEVRVVVDGLQRLQSLSTEVNEDARGARRL